MDRSITATINAAYVTTFTAIAIAVTRSENTYTVWY